MTSNIGSNIIHEKFDNIKLGELERVTEKAKFELMELLKQTIRPEFLNRIDETIMFLPLTKEDVKQIVTIQLNSLKKLLIERNIHLVVTDDAFEHIAEVGYDPYFGARPVKRVIQREVLNELSKSILAGTVDTSQNVIMDMFDSKIVFRKPVTEKEEA